MEASLLSDNHATLRKRHAAMAMDILVID